MFRIRSLALLMSLSLVFLASCKDSTSDETIFRIDMESVSERLTGKAAQNTILLDSRSQAEYEAGHLPTAINLRIEDVAAGRTTGLSRFPIKIVYGQHPASSTAMALSKLLVSKGFGGVRLFEGGVDAWRSAGLPLESTDPEPLRVQPSPQ